MPFSLKKARDGGHVTDKELIRFGVLFMMVQDQVKISGKMYEDAARDFGGTGKSFKFAIYAAIKKLKSNNCYADEEQPANAEPALAFRPKGCGTKKRKAGDACEESFETAEQTPKKARGGKKDVIKAGEAEAEGDADEI